MAISSSFRATLISINILAGAVNTIGTILSYASLQVPKQTDGLRGIILQILLPSLHASTTHDSDRPSLCLLENRCRWWSTM